MVNKLNVQLGERSYPIYFSEDYEKLPTLLKDAGLGGKLLLVTDSNVEQTQYLSVKRVMENMGLEVIPFVFPAGEQSKNLHTVHEIYTLLIQNKFDRSSAILALGGGVVGDMVGYVASTFLRGIAFVQIPTTLLSQVDSSIGGKVGVDFLGYKNVIGAFYQPRLVYINVMSLVTLPKRQMHSGFAEVIKHCFIRSPDLLEYLEYNRDKFFAFDPDVLMYTIKENCKIKAEIVQKDERDETGERQVLNFGHTIGHAIETASNFSLLHGECVALGMKGAFSIAHAMQLIDDAVLTKVHQVFRHFSMMDHLESLLPQEIQKNIQYDKKMKNNQIYFVLPSKIGQMHNVAVKDSALILAAIKEICGV